MESTLSLSSLLKGIPLKHLEIIQIQRNEIKNPNWQEATSRGQFSVFCHVIKNKNANHLILKAQNRGMKEDKYAKILTKKQVCAIFHMRDIRKWRRHVGVSFKGTNMAPGNQQKHLFLSFPTNA